METITLLLAYADYRCINIWNMREKNEISEQPSAEYVQINEGLVGRTASAIQSTRDSVEEESGDPSITTALREVLVMGDGSTAPEVFKTKGAFLIGMTSVVRAGIDMPYDALVYVEGEEILENGAFSVVRMASWMRNDVVENKYMQSMNLEQLILDLAFCDVAQIGEEGELDEAWGVPVERLSLVTDFHDHNYYRYGQQEDLLKVDRLNVPSGLSWHLKVCTEEWHDDELRAAGLI